MPYLINNTINGEHLSLVVAKSDLKKAVNVIHNHIFGMTKKLNVIVFGRGNVGGTLIDQILSTADSILERRNLRLNIFGVANSKKVLLDNHGISGDWRAEFDRSAQPYTIDSILEYIEQHNLENVVVVDNTASATFVQQYPRFIKAGFDIVSSNKVANTISYDFYSSLRALLRQKGKTFLYETNVGAGLPLVDTIRQLHHSGDKILRIRGVFSGTLSYIFNHFSEEDRPFYDILREAMDKGLTEPDPREDLCGNDVARKLLILAREIDLHSEFSDIRIENLIPEPLRSGTVEDFLSGADLLNSEYGKRKAALAPDEVLRYVGDLDAVAGTLEVKLVQVKRLLLEVCGVVIRCSRSIPSLMAKIPWSSRCGSRRCRHGARGLYRPVAFERSFVTRRTGHLLMRPLRAVSRRAKREGTPSGCPLALLAELPRWPVR